MPVTQAANSVDKWHLNARLDHRLHMLAFKRNGGGQSNFFDVFTSYRPSSSSILVRIRHPVFAQTVPLSSPIAGFRQPAVA